MQEWKKIWGYGTHGVDPLELSMLHHQTPTFQVTTEGITLLEADQVVPPSMKAEGALDHI